MAAARRQAHPGSCVVVANSASQTGHQCSALQSACNNDGTHKFVKAWNLCSSVGFCWRTRVMLPPQSAKWRGLEANERRARETFRSHSYCLENGALHNIHTTLLNALHSIRQSIQTQCAAIVETCHNNYCPQIHCTPNTSPDLHEHKTVNGLSKKIQFDSSLDLEIV